MGLVVTQNPILLTGDEAGLTPDHPVIGWQNIVMPGSITSAIPTASGFPLSNMANPATHLTWKSSGALASAGFLNITTGTTAPVDYVAIARHNFAGAGATVQIGKLTPSFAPITPEQLLPDNGPALFRFSPETLANVIVRIGPSTMPVQNAVLFAGKLLTLPRKIYQGFAPINYARIAKVTNGRSEAGQFLGRIVLQEFVKNSIPLSLIDPLYFRNHMADFLIYSKEFPFFFAWRPQTYPNEIGYCHMTNDPLPTNEAPHGLIAMQMEMTGVV